MLVTERSSGTAFEGRRINTCEEREIRYWTEALGISRATLFDAIRRVGNESDDVKTYLATGSQPIHAAR